MPGRAPIRPTRPELGLLLAVSLLAGEVLAADDVALLVLGIAQDAGYPQAGCYQPHCQPGWDNPAMVRHAVSLAVIDAGAGEKFLFEATPDIRHQLHRLHAAAPDGEYALNGVFLTHAHIGHYAGLMHFGHEVMGAKGVPVYAMPRMREYLRDNGPWSQLVAFENIVLRPLADGERVALNANVAVTPMLVPHRDEFSETVGYRIDGPDRSALFIPDIDKWDRWARDLVAEVRRVDYAFIDASFYADGELPGRDMSKILHPFVTESMDLLTPLTAEERAGIYFIHFNHTNPLLHDGSEAQDAVEAAGFRVAREGMRLPL